MPLKDTNKYTEPPTKNGIINRTKEEVSLQEQGYRLRAYKHPFGEMPTYSKTTTGCSPLANGLTTITEIVFVHDGTVKSHIEMCKWLETCWTPDTEEEWIWFLNDMHHYLLVDRPMDWTNRFHARMVEVKRNGAAV